MFDFVIELAATPTLFGAIKPWLKIALILALFGWGTYMLFSGVFITVWSCTVGLWMALPRVVQIAFVIGFVMILLSG